MGVDWTDLPRDILELIMSERLTSIRDLISLCKMCVCQLGRHLPPQLPWLILPRGPDNMYDEEEAHLGSLLSLYDLSESRTRILDLPEIQGKRICASSCGWLILEKKRKVSLLNPITRDEITTLPSLIVEPNSFPGDSRGEILRYAPIFSIKKAILSHSPVLGPENPDCIVMALFVGSWDIAFCKVGEKCWNTIPKHDCNPAQDISYKNDLFYIIYANGHVAICNLMDRKLTYVESCINENNPYPARFVPLCAVEGGGDEPAPLIFCWDLPDRYGLLMLSEEHKKWLPVKKEDCSNIYFFGGCFHCLSIPAAMLQLKEWEGNSMCFTLPEHEKMVGETEYVSCSIISRGIDNDNESTLLASHLGVFDGNELGSYYSRPCFLWHMRSLI